MSKPKQLNKQKFCGWCSAKVIYRTTWMSECSGCGYQNYFNPKPCSNITVLQNNKALLVQRAIKPKKGYFDLPGGFMDITDQTMEDCAYRELKEELGINKSDITPLKYLGSSLTPDYNWQNSIIKNVGFFFVTSIINTNFKIKLDQSENSRAIWIGKNDIAKINFAWDIDKQILTSLLNK